MRITTVISSLRGGGAERVCVNLANAWAARGHAVTVVTTSQYQSPPVYPLDPRVACREARAGKVTALEAADMARGAQHKQFGDQLALLVALRKTILESRPDVVVSHINLTNLRVIAALYETGVPVVACEHTDAKRMSIGRWQGVRDALYPRARAVVAPHASIAEWLSRRGAPARAIANALHPPPPVERRASARRRLVALTRLSREKRPDLAVRAFARVAADFPDWDLDIHGNGSLRAQLTEQIADLSLGHRIRLHGFTIDPYEALAGSELFVSTSWVEGFGNAIWEALACGIPVVTMDCGAPVRDLVRDGVDGVIVRTDTTTALAGGLRSLMADDAARSALAARAAEVVTRFSLDSALGAWDALLDEVQA